MNHSRREFLRDSVLLSAAAAGASVGLTVSPHPVAAQPAQSGAGVVDMPAESYRAVWKPAKPNATPVVDEQGIEALERRLACPCPCTLDVYTCRTTDFSCGISPAVHADVLRLVEGGYSADEIMAAMTETYGDFILMTPRKQGFNLLAWFAPFAAVGAGAVVIAALLRRWRINGEAAAAIANEQASRLQMAGTATSDGGVHADETVGPGGASVTPSGATREELDRLAAALRDDR